MRDNTHARDVDAPVERLGPLLDRLGGPDDALWPAPAWVPMRLERPLAVGVDGGHGPIRYRVTEHEPGRRVRFEFHPRAGLEGHHELALEPLGAGRTRVRHHLAARPTRPAMWVLAPAVERLHDAVLEDLLDNAEREATGSVRAPARWSPFVRVVRALVGRVRPRAVPVPAEADLARAVIADDGGIDRAGAPDLLDAWAVPRHRRLPEDPQVWADAVFRRPPRWVAGLLGVRQVLVRLVGIEPGSAESFATRARTGSEVLLGEDAAHLDFRASVHVSATAVTLTTVARARNRRGRCYLLVVRRLHAPVVRAMLARAWRDLAARTVGQAGQHSLSPSGAGA